MGGLKDWIDTVAEVVEQSVNNGQAAAEQRNIETWTAEGRAAGDAAAREDYATGQWQSNPIVEVTHASDPQIAEGSTFNEFQLPSFSNPYLAALEIALTPTELNVGEFAHRDAFEAGRADGYRDGMFNAFDQQLNDRFAPPAEHDPGPVAPSVIDCMIPPLDPSPTVDWAYAAGVSEGFYRSGGVRYKVSPRTWI